MASSSFFLFFCYSSFSQSIHTSYLPACEDGTECSETSAYIIQTPGNYPEESIQHSERGESLKARMFLFCVESVALYNIDLTSKETLTVDVATWLTTKNNCKLSAFCMCASPKWVQIEQLWITFYVMYYTWLLTRQISLSQSANILPEKIHIHTYIHTSYIHLWYNLAVEVWFTNGNWEHSHCHLPDYLITTKRKQMFVATLWNMSASRTV